MAAVIVLLYGRRERAVGAGGGPLGEATATRELDSQLRDAGLGYRGAGWRAARLAERLAGAVEQLINAAMTGRTRARGDVAPERDR